MARFLPWKLNLSCYHDIITLLLTCQIDVATTFCDLIFCRRKSYDFPTGERIFLALN